MALSALVQTVSNAKRNNYSDCIVTLFAYIYNRLQPKAANRTHFQPQQNNFYAVKSIWATLNDFQVRQVRVQSFALPKLAAAIGRNKTDM